MSQNPFEQPYLASNDNRSIVGIDCPVCLMRNKAVFLTSVPVNQAVRLFVDNDLSMRALSNMPIPFGDPLKLPEGCTNNDLTTIWRCESCELAFHDYFDSWNIELLKRQIYSAEYARIIPQANTELPKFRSTFVRNLFQANISNLNICVCETSSDLISKDMKSFGVKAVSYDLFKTKQPKNKIASFDLICTFSMLERFAQPERILKRMLSMLKQNGAILVSHYLFNHRKPEDHALLSPRNGILRLYSRKSLESVFSTVKLNHIEITPTMTLLYRNELPEFARFLKHKDISAQSIMDNKNIEGDETTEEFQQLQLPTPEQKEDGPSPSKTALLTQRMTVRPIRYGMVAYNHHDTLVGKSLEEYGEYLIGDHELLQQLIRPNWVVFDIAANIGLHCLMIAPLLNQGGQIHAFEPYSESHRLLGMNLMLNEINNVSTYRHALGETVGVTRLAYVDADAPGSMASNGWSAEYNGEEVMMSTIDTLDPTACHFIHVCTPEVEPSVLQGAVGTIEKFQPALLVNCVNEPDFKTIFAILAKLEYRMYWHIQPFYNAENFFGNTENVFGNAGAAKIFALHSSKNQNVGLKEIRTEDDWIA